MVCRDGQPYDLRMEQSSINVRQPTQPLPPWLRNAKDLLQVREFAGTKHHPQIIAWLKDVGIKGAMLADETAWCAACANGVLKSAGIPGTGNAMARSFLGWGVPLLVPRLGCVAVYSRVTNPPNPAAGHVAFWIADFGDDDLIWGGNQGNACSFALRPRDTNLGYRWPSRLSP